MLIPHLHAYLTLDIRFIQVVLSVIKCANVMKDFFFSAEVRWGLAAISSLFLSEDPLRP